MNQNVQPHSGAWVSFTYASFFAAAAMVGAGILFLPLDWWAKGYLAMGCVMLVQSCITMTKTVRDMHEASKLVNRIEDARTERLLMDVGKPALRVSLRCRSSLRAERSNPKGLALPSLDCVVAILLAMTVLSVTFT